MSKPIRSFYGYIQTLIVFKNKKFFSMKIKNKLFFFIEYLKKKKKEREREKQK